jgi:hypothetical protein
MKRFVLACKRLENVIPELIPNKSYSEPGRKEIYGCEKDKVNGTYQTMDSFTFKGVKYENIYTNEVYLLQLINYYNFILYEIIDLNIIPIFEYKDNNWYEFGTSNIINGMTLKQPVGWGGQ